MGWAVHVGRGAHVPALLVLAQAASLVLTPHCCLPFLAQTNAPELLALFFCPQVCTALNSHPGAGQLWASWLAEKRVEARFRPFQASWMLLRGFGVRRCFLTGALMGKEGRCEQGPLLLSSSVLTGRSSNW